MNHTIRDGVFETNSSSSHSLVYDNTVNTDTYDFNFDNVDDNGFIHIETKHFDDDFTLVQTPSEKLSYLVTQIALRCVIFDAAASNVT